MQIFKIAVGGGRPQRLSDDDAGLLHPQVSPDGRYVACSRLQWIKELRRIKLNP